MSDRLIALSTSLMIAGIIFLLDAFFLPIGIGAGTCYVAAVLFALFSPHRSDILFATLVCIALAFTAAWISYGDAVGTERMYIIPSRCLAAFAIIATALVGWSRKGFENRLKVLNLELSDRADTSDREAEAHQERLTLVELDLDERKIVEREYRHKIARYRSLIEALPLNVFQKDLEGKLRFGNLRYFETLGMTPEQAIGKSDIELFPSEQAEKYRADDLKVVQKGETIEMIEEHIRKNGDKLYVQVFKTPVLDDEKNIVGSQGMFWDVTARMLAEQAQQQSDLRFRRLVKSNILGIAWTKFDGRILDANQAYLDMVGYTMDDVLSGALNWHDMTPPEYVEADAEKIRRTKEDSYCEPMEKEYIHSDGHHVPVLIGTALLEGDEFICFILDISRQKENERELEQARDAANAANRSKSLFLANMSHEIRTPLNAIIGMTEMVLDSPLERDQAEYLNTVVSSGEALLSIINDVLDFSKVEAGKLTLEPIAFSLRETLAGTMKSLAVRAHAKKLELVFDVETHVPETVMGDVGRLRQVLTNLVGNAVKFTEQGEIIVTVVVANRIDDEIDLHFSVADTGIGISQKNQEHVFGAFEQADNTSTRVYGGTGLGLAICRSLVELMGGNIWVESEPGVGSTFHFTTRMATVPNSEVEQVRKFLGDGRVLICDDNRATGNCLASLMLRWDLMPTIVNSHERALEEYQSAVRDGTPFQVAMIDAHMPGSDSFELLQRILASEDKICQPIMMLNSTDMSEDVSKCQKLDNTPYLLKPIGPSDLYDVVATVLNESDFEIVKEFSEEQQEVTPTDMPRLRVLLAEDSIVNQKLVLGILGKYDHDVVVANNGLEAVETYESSEAFDVVLMDVQMPRMDGLSATKRIREIEQTTGDHIPIIAMTAHAMSGDRERCLDAGMDEYISKPIRIHKFVELFSKVSSEDRARRLNAAADKSTSATHDSNLADTRLQIPILQTDENGNLVAATGQVNNDQLGNGKQGEQQGETMNSDSGEVDKHVDIDKAMEAVGDDKDLLIHLVDAFKEEAPRLLTAMREAVEANDAGAVRHNAHTLKGSMRLFAADQAYDLAYQIETIKDDGVSDAAPTLEKLVVEIDAVTAELNTLYE